MYIALERHDGGLLTVSAGKADRQTRIPTRRMVHVLRIEQHLRQRAEQRPTSVAEILAALRPMLPWLLVASFLSNVLGLLTPLLIMGIYDRVIPTGSIDLLISLVIGVCVILATDFSFRHARSLALAYVGRNVEYTLTTALFRKLMALPLQVMQKSEVDQQLSRFRQFESLRDVFTGQVMSSLLDLPFALIFLSILLYLSPQVGILTLGVAVFFVVFSSFVIPAQRRLDTLSAEANASSRTLLNDAVLNQRALLNLGLADIWRTRSTPLVEEAEYATRRARQFQSTTQSFAQTITALATVGAIVLSARAALSGDLSFGGLIAVIALVSKVMAPLLALHANTLQILTFLQSKTQADRVLALKEEFELGQATSHQKTLQGAVRFSAVTFRPDPLTNPILNQVSFSSKSREIVVVMGSDLAGRTALLDLIGGLYVPQAGTIEHDGIDIRQIACDELRRSITTAGQDSSLFYGTLVQNFRLAAPTLTEAEMARALAHVGVPDEIDGLPDGLHSRLRDDAASLLPEHTLKALTIARSIARAAPIYLFSEPTSGLNNQGRTGFKAWLAQQKGHQTIFVATSDRSFLQLADRYVFLDNGRLTVNDTGDQGLKKITVALQNLEDRA
ncbi:peptidase domain-containing ABC transporter [Aliiroseovarius sp. 2305UL8-7]|uniref:peptidase domain-containing ABC transporter n=1 Tax=Aliiroseovarius conchicola TaxID=3121637 RepID=UPI003528A130